MTVGWQALAREEQPSLALPPAVVREDLPAVVWEPRLQRAAEQAWAQRSYAASGVERLQV